jgi:S-(hydroxymethyl)glutathione dehydrogenase/alcohol dehydrogenase
MCKQGRGKTIAIGAGLEPVVPFGFLAILVGRTLKGSIFGGIKATSDLSIIANKYQKEVQYNSFDIKILLFRFFLF